MLIATMICNFSDFLSVITFPQRAKESFGISTRAALDATLAELDGVSFPVEHTTVLNILKAEHGYRPRNLGSANSSEVLGIHFFQC